VIDERDYPTLFGTTEVTWAPIDVRSHLPHPDYDCLYGYGDVELRAGGRWRPGRCAIGCAGCSRWRAAPGTSGSARRRTTRCPAHGSESGPLPDTSAGSTRHRPASAPNAAAVPSPWPPCPPAHAPSRTGHGQNALLVVLPGPGREAEVRRAIGIPGIPAATAANPITDPATPLWLQVGKHDERVRLAALTGTATSA
jgi:hypothetical protein